MQLFPHPAECPQVAGHLGHIVNVADLETRFIVYQDKSRLWPVLLFWRIGQQHNSEILNHQRAEYGQKAPSKTPCLLDMLGLHDGYIDHHH